MSTSFNPGNAPTCSLEGRSFQHRVAWIAALNQKHLRNSHRDGRMLTLAYDLAAHPEVEELVQREKECCSFLDLAIREADPLTLVITVPEEVAGNVDDYLAPFLGRSAATDAAECCGGCDVPAATTKVPAKAASWIGLSATASTTALVACGACCVIPLVVPAIGATALGGALAWFGRAHAWITIAAVLVVVLAWGWIAYQHRVRNAKISRVALAGMAASTLLAALAVAWPQFEPALLAALG